MPVTYPPEMMRRSFAVYYYTQKAPADWDGTAHSTIFKARPDEWIKGNVKMPIENAVHNMRQTFSSAKANIRSMLKS
ncbi:MAG: hypothetical protein SFU55_04385 [Methylophilus sp.]|nr:hypothetical protein [Methylophilus sp.]